MEVIFQLKAWVFYFISFPLEANLIVLIDRDEKIFLYDLAILSTS